MQKELFQTHDAIASLCDDPQTNANLTAHDHGVSLPVIVLECFIAEDARVHRLRLAQEIADRFLQRE